MLKYWCSWLSFKQKRDTTGKSFTDSFSMSLSFPNYVPRWLWVASLSLISWKLATRAYRFHTICNIMRIRELDGLFSLALNEDWKMVDRPPNYVKQRLIGLIVNAESNRADESSWLGCQVVVLVTREEAGGLDLMWSFVFLL